MTPPDRSPRSGPGGPGPRGLPPRTRPRRAPDPTVAAVAPAPSARALALEALARIDDGAFANLTVPRLLDTEGRSLERRDRALVTQLAYGVTRQRRALDALVDRHARGPLDDETRRVLRLGAFQLWVLRTPPHAAVSATVDLAPRRSRGLVNAVLRRVAEDVAADERGTRPLAWASEAERLSFPDWIADRLVADLGAEDAAATMRHLDGTPTVTEREDGYVQDAASQWVAELVGVQPGERVLDLCAAPGGKSTAMAAGRRDVTVVAADVHRHRAALVGANVRRLGLAGRVLPVVADGTRAPFRPATFDRILVDAPCSGLGVLHRRPDARWRIEPSDVDDLVVLQRALLDAAVALLRPGGTLVYSVCTLTDAETIGVDEWLAGAHPALEALPAPGSPWRPHGRGARLLPQDAGTDGMSVFRYVLRESRPDERTD